MNWPGCTHSWEQQRVNGRSSDPPTALPSPNIRFYSSISGRRVVHCIVGPVSLLVMAAGLPEPLFPFIVPLFK